MNHAHSSLLAARLRLAWRRSCHRLPGAFWLASVLLASSSAVHAAPLAYVVNHNSSSVSVIDTASRAVIDTLNVGEFPFGIATSPIGRFIFVSSSGPSSNEGPGDVTIFDARTRTVIAIISIDDSPEGVAVSSDGRHAYVTTGSGLSIIDIEAALRDEAVIVSVPFGTDPAGVALTPDGRYAYVTNLASAGAVFIIDTEVALTGQEPALAVIGMIPTGNSPLGIAVSPDGHRAYVTNSGFASNVVSVIDVPAQQVVGTVSAGSRPSDVAITPGGRYAYVTNLISNSVSIIDTTTNVAVSTVPVGRTPQGVSISPDGTFAYVSNRQSIQVPTPGDVSVVDTVRALLAPQNAVVASIAVGSNPVDVVVAPVPLTALMSALFVEIQSLDADVNGDDLTSVADVAALLREQGAGFAPL